MNKVIVVGVIVAVACLLVGIGIGYGIGKAKYDDDEEDHPKPTSKPSTGEKDRRAQHRGITDKMDMNALRQNLKEMTKSSHLAGSPENKQLGDHILSKWKDEGLDKVESFKYNIYLPKPRNNAIITPLDDSGNAITEIEIKSGPAHADSEKPDVVAPFNAFGVSGEVTAPIVYCNYGRNSDFAVVENLNITLAGKILMFRYGKTSRSNKVHRSELRGAIGAIIFSDPYDIMRPGEDYPNGFLGNLDGIQRGTVNRINGDSLSIGYPSKDGYFRNESKYDEVYNVKIPSQPISPRHAMEIFSHFVNVSKDYVIPESFIGELNATYLLESNRNFTLKTDIEFKTRDSYTVCGTIYGDAEPDRYVMLGNHRDSWTYGAADAASGTAVIMEIGRVLGLTMKKKNWRPRRSIMICSWGSEEPGILGSYEWAYEHQSFLTNNVVMYLNIDLAVEGNYTVRIRTLDSLAINVKDAAKELSAADDPSITLFEDWRLKSAALEEKDPSEMPEPKHSMLTSGSDYKALWHMFGVASVDYRYYFNKLDYPRLGIVAQYHTRYDSFDWMTKWVDPKMKYHQTIGRLMLATALKTADSDRLPINIHVYTKQIKYYFDRFVTYHNDRLVKHNVSMDFASERLDALMTTAESFQKHVDSMSDEMIASPLVLRKINDKIMYFERSFLVSNLIKREGVRHAIFATNFFTLSSRKFPGISEAIYFASKDPSNDWDDVRKQITLVIWCFDTANKSLDIEP